MKEETIKVGTKEEVREKMSKLLGMREADYSIVNKELERTKAAAAAALEKMQNAMELSQLEEFAAAKKELAEAETAREMYLGRLEQLQKQEFVKEEESDQVIDSLLVYEDELAAGFLNDIRKPLEKIRDIYGEYCEDVAETERLIIDWCSQIHANYRSRGTTRFWDKEKGMLTDRSPLPYPVHRIPYTGSKEANIIGSFLRKIDKELEALGANDE